MGAQNDEAIRVAANGNIYVAPVGTTEPATEIATPGSGWVLVGDIDENGVTFSDGRTIVDIPKWQSNYPARRVVTAKDDKVSFNIRQWDRDTVDFALGGVTITEPTAGHFKIVPPPIEKIDERALMVDWVDGDFHYRWIYRRGTVADPVAIVFKRAQAADLPIGFGLLGPPTGVADPWILLTDDPNMAPVGS